MKHAPKKHHTKHHTKRPKSNPKGLASAEEHEGLTTMQRLARAETAIRQLKSAQDADREMVQKALTAQTHFNDRVTKVLRGALG